MKKINVILLGLADNTKQTYIIGLKNKVTGEYTQPVMIDTDLNLFKRVTNDSIVIMGRNTYEAIGRPLPNRINVVITSNKELLTSDIRDSQDRKQLYAFSSLEEALDYFKDSKLEIFIIGGGQLYRTVFTRFINLLNTIHLSIVYSLIDLDTSKYDLIKVTLPSVVQLAKPTYYERSGINVDTGKRQTYSHIKYTFKSIF